MTEPETGRSIVWPPELSRSQQVRMHRTTADSVESTLVDSKSFDAHVADGWTVDDPAFAPDSDVVALAEDAPDGRVLMQAGSYNPGGNTKRVLPADVAWHQQNGWTIA